MDVLSSLLMSIDAVKSQLFKKSKNDADDYYELVAPLNHHVMKMNDGSMITFFELRGLSKILTETEKKKVCNEIDDNLRGFLSKSGYNIQIVDLSDPELTRVFAKESMKASIEELANMGLDHSVLTTDYLDFIAEKAIWKKQYVIVTTTAKTLKTDKEIKRKISKEELKEIKEQSEFIADVLRTDANNQVVFSSDREKAVFSNHSVFYKAVLSEFSGVGVLVRLMDVSKAFKAQRVSLYGASCSNDWEPTLGHFGLVKNGTNSVSPGVSRLEGPSMVEQIITEGGTEENLPIDVLKFGDRFFSTVSMVIPQKDANKMKGYQYLTKRIAKDVGYISSFRIASNPYGDSSYNTEQIFLGMSTILPMSGNQQIKNASNKLKEKHDNDEKTMVFLEFTITLFSNSLEDLLDNKKMLNNSVLAGWNSSKFRNVELDKTQGLFDTLPGFSKDNNLKQVIENLSDVLYQSPIFTSGVIYDSGYLHMLTEDKQPFPLEEHSSLNINYNAYICGTPGSGKSTLLVMLNLALIAKPKANPKLRGEMPVIMDVDFGKTSFGFKKLLRKISPESKKKNFLIHEMSDGVESAVNPHDLPPGRMTPTVRQKNLLVRFLTVLICGIETFGSKEDKEFKIKYSGLEAMISFMVKTVYNYRSEDSNPRSYSSSEFYKHKSTIEYMKKIGINATSYYSYYALADEIMEKDPENGIFHAVLLRRYAVPRLSDYSEVLTNNPEIGAKYSEGVIEKGLSPLRFFMERLGDVLSEFPCFSRPTVISIDFARMISIDIKNVCGDDDYRKAVFGSLCLMMFFLKRENFEESPDLANGVPEQYLPYLKRMDQVNRILPGSLNIEEAHMLFSLFDDLLVSAERHNRKGGWGLKALSQKLMDPSKKLFSMGSMVFITSKENVNDVKVKERLQSIQASRKEMETIHSEIKNRNLFLYVQTKPTSADFAVDRIAIKLQMAISPGLLWVSTSEQVDIGFRDSVIDAVGDDIGLMRLSKFFKGGSVRAYYESTDLKKLAEKRGLDSVHSLLVDEVSRLEKPSDELSRLL